MRKAAEHTRLSRSRSWPALTPRPSACASSAARAYTANDSRALRLAALERARKRLGVQLDAVGAHICRPPIGASSGSTNRLTRTPAHADQRRRAQAGRAACRRDQPAWLVISPGMDRHERALIRLDRVHELQQIRPRVAFDIELDAPPSAARRYAAMSCTSAGRDVPRVGARMHGDPRRAGVDADA